MAWCGGLLIIYFILLKITISLMAIYEPIDYQNYGSPKFGFKKSMEHSWNMIMILCMYRTSNPTNIRFWVSLWATRFVLVIYLFGIAIGSQQLLLAC